MNHEDGCIRRRFFEKFAHCDLESRIEICEASGGNQELYDDHDDDDDNNDAYDDEDDDEDDKDRMRTRDEDKDEPEPEPEHDDDADDFLPSTFRSKTRHTPI